MALRAPGIADASAGDQRRGLVLGFASHLLAGLSPFIVAEVIARTDPLPGTALVYVIGAAALALLLAAPVPRRRLAKETRQLIQRPMRGPFLTSLAGFLVAGIAYYVGLASSARVAEYVFLTRLDWVVQAPVAILVLREPWTRAGLGGAALALAGGLLIVWTGVVGSNGLLAATGYIVASLAGYLGATRIARERGVPGAVTLTVWRHWVNTAGFVMLAALVMRDNALQRPDNGTLGLALVSATVLIGLFLCRFAALTRLPLWVLSAQAPVQALVALAASRVTEGTPSPTTLAAVAMIATGELIVASNQRRSSHIG
jgi:drug/metabolite transporter (DMT)-like permease